MTEIRLTRRLFTLLALVLVGSLVCATTGSAKGPMRVQGMSPCPPSAAHAPMPDRLRAACRHGRHAHAAAADSSARVAGSRSAAAQSRERKPSSATAWPAVLAGNALLVVVIGCGASLAAHRRRLRLEARS